MMRLIRRILFKFRGEMDIDSLKLKGLTIGEDVFINFGCVIDESFCHLISIGDRVTFAPRVHVLAHDASTKKVLGYSKIGCVTIGDDVFVGAGSIILPNVTIGNKVVIGAGSVVTKNIPDNSVVVGSPTHVINTYDAYMNKEKEKMSILPVYDYAHIVVGGGVTENTKMVMRKELTATHGGFIV